MLALVPLAVLYPLAIIAISGEPPNATLMYSLVSVVLAAGLAVASWWVAGRFAWPDRPGLGFYAAHLAGGLTYAFVWWVGAAAVRAALGGNNVLRGVREAVTSQFFPWNLLFGVLIYGLCVGLSYAVRSQEAIREQRLNTARAEAIAARARLTALQARLNPHFLFNALHSLAALIRFDPDLAEEAVDRLGDLFRYALDRSGSDTVALADEWQFVEDYLAIEQLRLGERLRISTQVDEDVLEARVPPFCLQPLVENAIRHGLTPVPRGGTLRICAQAVNGNLVLEVTDDGAGMRADALATTEGFGLRAVREHVEQSVVGSGSLEIETTPGAGCCARVSLPLASPQPAAVSVAGGEAQT